MSVKQYNREEDVMRETLFAFFIGLLAVLLLMPGIADSDQDSIHIGATVSQTGHFSTEIGPFKRLMNAWADLVNAQGGIMLKEYNRRLPVKFTTYDDKSDEATVKKFYERLVTVDKADILLGPYSSPLTFAASTAAENHKIPFIGTTANSPKIYERGFKWIVTVIDLGPRYTYRYWNMLKDEGSAKTVSFVVEDTIHPLSVFDGSLRFAEEIGLKVLSSDIIPARTHDFTPVIAKLKQKDPDIVFVSSNIPFAVDFIKQARELNLNPREYHCIHHSGVFLKPLGDNAESIIGQSYWVEGMKVGNVKLIHDVLNEAEVSEPMYPWSPVWVAAFQIIQAGIQKAGTLKNTVFMDTLKNLTIETVLGRVYFHETGYGSINTYPSQIQNGTYKLIYPPEVATGKHIYPRAAWRY
jgi:branched-chain amino acid transport system substrate-binding protein